MNFNLHTVAAFDIYSRNFKTYRECYNEMNENDINLCF